MLVSNGVQRRDATATASGSSRVHSGVGISEVLRARILSSAVALVGDVGYAQITVERVVRLSGVSQDTFYKCFDDLDACLLAAFEDALGRIAAVVLPAYEGEREWPAKVRAAVAALLAILDDEPTMSMFVFVGALGAGPKVLACRLEALDRLKIAFEHGINEAGGVAGSALAESSPLSAEGAINAVLGIVHTRMLEASPLARRPLSELAGPLTAMIVLPYVGHVAAGSSTSDGAGALAATRASSGPARAGSKVRPKVGARKAKRPRLNAQQRAILTALEDGPLTVRELVDLTGLSDQATRNKLTGLLGRDEIVKTQLGDRVGYDLPAKKRAAAERETATRSSPTPESLRAPADVEAASNGASSSASNGAAASNGHGRSAVTKAMLEGLETPISKREVEVLNAIDELAARGSSLSNREIGNAVQIYDPTQLSKLIKHLAQLWLVENTGWIEGKQYAWRLTTKATELLRQLGGKTVGGTHPADARA
jgi:AcrR family transcriptional regulator